ncbi:MAG: hypothetical protein ACON5F_02295 [Jejuia sp.]
MEKVRYRKSDAVKILEDLVHKAKIARYPNFPYHPPTKYRDDSANGLTRCIIDFLNHKGQQAERINNTGRQIDRRKTVTDVLGRQRTVGSTEWIKGTGQNGTADISSTIDSKSIKIEIKIGKDRQSNSQKEYQRQVEQAGGIYIIARTFQGFYEWYNEFINSKDKIKRHEQ